MSTEIERKNMTEDQRPPRQQPDPIQTLNAVATMTALTLGFVIGGHIGMTINMRRIHRMIQMPQVKEVVVIVKDASEIIDLTKAA